jgi:peroxiredoxin family protein
VSIVVISDDLDKAFSAFNIANGAAASGLEVTMFFTCWGVNILKKKGSLLRGDNIVSKLMNFLTRGGASRLGLSKFNFLGTGCELFRLRQPYGHLWLEKGRPY